MPAAPIVPKGHGMLAPPEPAGEAFIARMFEQEIQQWPALSLGHAGKSQREGRIDVKPLTTGFRVGADDGMFELWRIDGDF